MERWATFDCYGTLVDWNAGIGGELQTSSQTLSLSSPTR
jgi:FMN phosphatase YigB (HAD superfamily)